MKNALRYVILTAFVAANQGNSESGLSCLIVDGQVKCSNLLGREQLSNHSLPGTEQAESNRRNEWEQEEKQVEWGHKNSTQLTIKNLVNLKGKAANIQSGKNDDDNQPNSGVQLEDEVPASTTPTDATPTDATPAATTETQENTSESSSSDSAAEESAEEQNKPWWSWGSSLQVQSENSTVSIVHNSTSSVNSTTASTQNATVSIVHNSTSSVNSTTASTQNATSSNNSTADDSSNDKSSSDDSTSDDSGSDDEDWYDDDEEDDSVDVEEDDEDSDDEDAEDEDEDEDDEDNEDEENLSEENDEDDDSDDEEDDVEEEDDSLLMYKCSLVNDSFLCN